VECGLKLKEGKMNAEIREQFGLDHSVCQDSLRWFGRVEISSSVKCIL